MTVDVSTRTEMTGGGAPCNASSADAKLRSLLALTVPVSVALAERDMDIESLLAIRIGTIIEFDVPFDSDLVVHAGNLPIAMGQAVKTGENFGTRITSIDTVAQRVEALGGKHRPD